MISYHNYFPSRFAPQTVELHRRLIIPSSLLHCTHTSATALHKMLPTLGFLQHSLRPFVKTGFQSSVTETRCHRTSHSWHFRRQGLYIMGDPDESTFWLLPRARQLSNQNISTRERRSVSPRSSVPPLALSRSAPLGYTEQLSDPSPAWRNPVKLHTSRTRSTGSAQWKCFCPQSAVLFAVFALGFNSSCLWSLDF